MTNTADVTGNEDTSVLGDYQPVDVSQYDMRPGTLANRVRLITSMNRYMVDRPDIALQLASQPIPVEQLMDTAVSSYGAMRGQAWASQLSGLSASTQRAMWATMTPAQQLALGQVGYGPPKVDEGSWTDALGPVGDLLGEGLGAIGTVGTTVLSPVLDVLGWVGDVPGRIYRANRLISDEAGMFGAIGAGLGVAAALVAAPLTGGGSLAALGMLGLGATGGMAAGGILGSAILGESDSNLLTNPGDWFRAWNTAGDGERTFDKAARSRATELLGDPRLNGLANDLAADDDFDMMNFAADVAAVDGGFNPSTSQPMNTSQLGVIEKIAARMATPGSPEFQRAYQSMIDVFKDSTFQQAVAVLQNGKISVGRDLADQLGFDPGSSMHNLISGATDLAFTVAVDPTLILGKASQWNKARKWGMGLTEGPAAVARFLELSNGNKAIRALHTIVAKAVDTGDVTLMRQMAPEFMQAWLPMTEWADAQKLIGRSATGMLDNGGGIAEFGLKEFQTYMTGVVHLAPLMKGVGTVRGAEGVILAGTGFVKREYREFAGGVRQLLNGMADAGLEKSIVKRFGAMTDDELLKHFDSSIVGGITDTGELLRSFDALHPESGSYDLGHLIGQYVKGSGRIAEFITSTSTMMSRAPYITIIGARAPEDIHAITELGRYLGQPSWVRRSYEKAILTANGPSDRVRILNGWLDNALTVSGARGTERGSALVDEFLRRNEQWYGVHDDVLVAGEQMAAGVLAHEMADAVAMPNLRELRKAAVTGKVHQMLGILDEPAHFLESAMTKVWKPAVLLRIGFIPRAAGEEFFNWMLRGGIGSLGQEFGAASLGRRNALELAQHQAVVDSRLLTPAQAELLADQFNSGLAAHLRPLHRMLDRYEWTKPMAKNIENYSTWLQDKLEVGAFGGSIERGTNRFLDALAGDAGRVAFDGGQVLQRGRQNATAFAESIIMGGKYSWRRMVAGGVHDDLVEAMTKYESGFSASILREVSSKSAGPLDRGYEPESVQMHTTYKDGELVETPVIVVKSRLQKYMRGDPLWMTSHHARIQATASDPRIQPWLEQYASRVRGTAQVADADLISWLDSWHTMEKSTSHSMALELIGNPSPEAQIAMLDRMTLAEPELVEKIRSFGGHQRLTTYDDMQRATTQWAIEGEQSAELARAEHLVNENEAKLVMTLERQGALRDPDRLAAADKAFGITADRLKRAEATARHRAQVMAEFDAQREVIASIERMNPRERQFVTQLLRSQGNAGEFIPRVPGELPQLYETWDEMAADSWQFLRGRVGATDNQNLLPETLHAVTGPGSLNPETRLVYRVPVMRHKTTDMTYAEVLANATNPAIIANNRATVEGLLAATKGRNITNAQLLFTADQELATELTRVFFNRNGWAQTANNAAPRALRVDRLAAQGNRESVLTPLVHQRTRDGEAPVIFLGAKDVLAGRMGPVPPSIDEAIDEITNQLMTKARQAFTRGDSVRLQAKTRLLEDGTREAVVYRRQPGLPTAGMSGSEGPLEPVGLDELINSNDQYFLRDGTPIKPTEARRYFEDVTGTSARLVASGKGLAPVPGTQYATQIAQGDPMWEVMGPILHDHFDAKFGTRRFINKKEIHLTPGNDPVGDPLIIPVRRSRVTDMHSVNADDLPAVVFGPALAHKPSSAWDRFVGFGFDKVIGPSIDALVREPMARHFYALRYVENKRLTTVLRNTETIDAAMSHINGLKSMSNIPASRAEELSVWSRQIARADGVAGVEHWTKDQALGYLRGFDADTLSQMALRHKVTVERQLRTLAGAQGAISRAGKVTEEHVATLRELVTTPAHQQTLDQIRGIIRTRGKALESNDPLAVAFDEVLQMFRGSATAKEMRASLRYTSQVIADNSRLGQAQQMFDKFDTPEAMLKYLETQLPEGSIASATRFESKHVQNAIKNHDLLQHLTAEQWDQVLATKRNLDHIENAAAEYAGIKAIEDMMPFIDSHELRTQFAEVGKPFLPFWYAEENFMKRWARAVIDDPAIVRKAQLTYMGLKRAGTVRTDENGKDYFVYPGSGLLQEAIAKIPGLGAVAAVGSMFQTPTDAVLPGLNSRFGTPAFSPLVSIPMGVLAAIRPEFVPVQKAIVGDYGASMSVLEQLIPTTLKSFADALTGTDADSARYHAAQLAAMAMLEAQGKGLADDATPRQRQDYLDRVADHARIITVAQAMMGFTAPGPSTPIYAGNTANLTGVGVHDIPGEISGTYRALIQNLGIEAGTIEFLAQFPEANAFDLVNPEALPIGKTESLSGAPIVASQQAVDYFKEHQALFVDMPDAMPWLLPQVDHTDPKVQQAADFQAMNGLRAQRSPDDFLDAILFKRASAPYFAMSRQFKDDMAQIEALPGKAQREQLKEQRQASWDIDRSNYLIAHPVFAEQLQSSEGRLRRQRILQQMNAAVNDPMLPKADHVDALKALLDGFNSYQLQLAVLKDRRTAKNVAQSNLLKDSFEKWATDWVAQNPKIGAFWNSVIRPEANFD